MVEISVKDLRWVYSGFKVKYNGKYCWIRYYCVEGYHVKNVDEFDFIGDNETVLVNPKEYEESCLDRINEMLGLELRTVKKIVVRDEPDNPFTYIMAYDVDDNDVHISCDPRPWEEEYVIHNCDSCDGQCVNREDKD